MTHRNDNIRIHWFQHLPFEGLGSMGRFFAQRGYPSASTHFYLNQPLPSLDDFDWLIIMGGAMSANDDAQYPWLCSEKEFIKRAIDSGKVIIGICLGAQLIAASLGAKVYRNKYREIGWFEISGSASAGRTILADSFTGSFDAFHWHGDTFDLPAGAIRLASSRATINQGFMIDSRIVGLQFHLETTPQSAEDLIANFPQELDGSRYVQSAGQMLSDMSRFERINAKMEKLFDTLLLANS